MTMMFFCLGNKEGWKSNKPPLSRNNVSMAPTPQISKKTLCCKYNNENLGIHVTLKKKPHRTWGSKEGKIHRYTLQEWINFKNPPSTDDKYYPHCVFTCPPMYNLPLAPPIILLRASLANHKLSTQSSL